MATTQENKQQRLLEIQTAIANIDYSETDAWMRKVALDQEIVNIHNEAVIASKGYDRLKAARDELRAIAELNRSKDKLAQKDSTVPVPYIPDAVAMTQRIKARQAKK